VEVANYRTTKEENMRVACAWCRRIRFNGSFVAVMEDLYEEIKAVFGLSHTICPDCRAAQFKAYNRTA
jgi:hypothetical protein